MDISKVLGEFARSASTANMKAFSAAATLPVEPQVEVAAAVTSERKSIFRDTGPAGVA
jgi:hypothetical protein